MNGASTNPDAHVFAYAAAQVKKVMEVTQRLGGQCLVFWGGREGYQSLLNTDVKQELDHMAAFFKMVVAYRAKIGATYQLLIGACSLLLHCFAQCLSSSSILLILPPLLPLPISPRAQAQGAVGPPVRLRRPDRHLLPQDLRTRERLQGRLEKGRKGGKEEGRGR